MTPPRNQKIAVIGGGISGLACAWLLAPRHRVTLYEANAYVGGHTNTVDVTVEGRTHPVDTGFLVFNDRTYPNLIRLFERLGVKSAPSDMSFSVRIGAGDLEWAGHNLSTVFAQRSNLVSPSFLRMLRDLLRFNKQTTLLAAASTPIRGTLGQFLDEGGYGRELRQLYLHPMAACIWSTPSAQVNRFPLNTFITFCHNHGLLAVSNRPQWRTVEGGGREYVRKLVASLGDVRKNMPVKRVVRDATGVDVCTDAGTERFDQVVMATHTDQTLGMLAHASEDERSVLEAIPYQPNKAVLHTDARLLPHRKRAWAAWNFFSPRRELTDEPVSLSYLINMLQPLPFKTPVVVTMNPQHEAKFAPDPRHVIDEYDYHHPVFLEGSDVAKARVETLQGQNRTWFAGAWTRYGFHEDGFLSAIKVAKQLEPETDW
ncbi:NAD/FAD-binding protein [Betaproteobacteria bacterium GR16-43]|nr:NAD/FAD-binding protein [Betaproteobacteria bacterium GR16-43]